LSRIYTQITAALRQGDLAVALRIFRRMHERRSQNRSGHEAKAGEEAANVKWIEAVFEAAESDADAACGTAIEWLRLLEDHQAGVSTHVYAVSLRGFLALAKCVVPSPYHSTRS
jgi:hypothetical protein